MSALDDPYGTARIREAVLAAWTTWPARLREDANTEQDYALGSYRDRLIVELAQNAADAAVRAGVPGDLLLELLDFPDHEGLEHGVLRASNTGAPLDPAGVEALATLRASAKREPESSARDHDPGSGPRSEPSPAPSLTVGRFGVGFSAVLSVSDEPAVIATASRAGEASQGVRFSAAGTLALLRAAGDGPGGAELAEELRRRKGQVPVLRLPFPLTAPADAAGALHVPAGYDTAVVLPLRSASARAFVLEALAGVNDLLLLALSALAEITVMVPGSTARRWGEVGTRWRTVARSGVHSTAQLADRGVEEREHRAWQVTWAEPRRLAEIDQTWVDPHSRSVPVWDVATGVLYAPTPTDEPLPWPAILIATLPLEPSRRRVSQGPATDAVILAAAQAYAEFVQEAPAERWWALVPTGLAHGPLDAALRVATLQALRTSKILSSPDGTRLAPERARVLEAPYGGDPALITVLGVGSADLVLADRAADPALRALAVERTTLAEAIDGLGDPADLAAWGALFAALAALATSSDAVEALARVPVPLADGRWVRGARGLEVLQGVMVDRGEALGSALALLGVRVLDPAALVAAPASSGLLTRLGADLLPPRALFSSRGVSAGVRAVLEDPQIEHIEAVLTVVAAALDDGLDPATVPGWLAELPLPDTAGDLVPARLLALPGSPAAALFEVGDVGAVDPRLLNAWGPAVLGALGVTSSLAVLSAQEVHLGRDSVEASGDSAHHPATVDGFDDWAEDLAEALGVDREGLDLERVDALADLDLVRSPALTELIAVIDGDPRLLAAVVTPVALPALDPTSSPGSASPTGPWSSSFPSVSAWWLRHEVADGRLWALPGAGPALEDLLPEVPAAIAPLLSGTHQLDPRLLRCLGGVGGWADLDPLELGRWDGVTLAEVREHLADPGIDVDAVDLLRWWRLFSKLSIEPDAALAPTGVRIVAGMGSEVVPAAEAVIVHEAKFLQGNGFGPSLWAGDAASAARLERIFGVPPLERVVGDLSVQGCLGWDPVPGEVATLLSSLGIEPPLWCEHEDLVIGGVSLQWWVDSAGVHACTGDGLAFGLAVATGRPPLRHALARLLGEPQSLATVLGEFEVGAEQ